jgi:hypothetical protein
VPRLLEGEGRTVRGRIEYDRRKNRCELVSEITV